MKARILIVDDEALILLGWEQSLKSAGYDVKTALNGKEALEITLEQKPDIVITDLIIPEMNGVELCRRIKTISPETEVLLISGHPEEIYNYQRDFISAGGRDAVLKKPLSVIEMIKAVETIMSEKA
jgi:twitching motility two-component system response regulator PilH